MREIDEYTAELRQRIAQKLEQRRLARKQLAACAASLVLVVGITAAVLLPGLRPGTDGRSGEARESTEAAPVSLCGAELWRMDQSGQWERSDRQPRAPAGLSVWIRSADPLAYAESDGDCPVDDSPETASEQEPVRILLTDENGIQMEYLFDGAALIRLPENRRVALTDQQIKELKSLLFED